MSWFDNFCKKMSIVEVNERNSDDGVTGKFLRFRREASEARMQEEDEVQYDWNKTAN